ncbi:DNA-binding protein WhiA [Alicyclobacillus acidiphilus]|uniref:DNA-binding protein WhiA n=1 Tax=Alicyclobacillus acidiphilus TaxID=182455 RepID=UPI00082F1498|nr:DNA-binding protein WhiA [Alicyclobacillus acidiphilus]
MSFAAETKKELTQLSSDPAESRHELMAIVALASTVTTIDGRQQLAIETENVATARRIYTLLKTFFQVQPEVVVRKKMRLKKNHVYAVRLTGSQAETVLEDLGYKGAWADGPLAPNWVVSAEDALQRAFLRGSFLASGSVNSPGSPSYHLEIYSPNQELGRILVDLMNSYDLHARMTPRKKGFIVYLKEGEKIVDFLNLIGAVRALLKFEDTRIIKGMRNQVNRLVNCETANMNKTISAAVRQMEHIRVIQNRGGLESLPEHLREVAEARIRHPEANLQELSKRLGGRVSKSGLNHRFKRIEDIANGLRMNPPKH